MASGGSLPLSSLRGRVMSAGAWSLGALVVGQALRLGGNLIMARLLVPEMFGVMLIATTVSVVLALFSDIGLRQNIIQSRRGEDPVFLNTAWTLQVLRGFVLYGLTLLVAAGTWLAQQWQWVPTGSAYAATELPGVLAATGLSAVIMGFQSTKLALAYRHFQQGRVAACELAGQVCGLVVMLGLGWWTQSIWSLVCAGLVSALVVSLASHLWIAGPANRLHWDAASVGELVRFGRWILLSSVLGVLAANGDRLWLGGVMSAGQLGVYSIAILLLGALETAVHKLAAAAVLPTLSRAARAGDMPGMRRAYWRLRLLLDSALLFVCGLLFMMGPLLVGWLYDTRYAEAGQMFSILACSLFALRYLVAQQLWLALGRSRYLAWDNLLRFLCLWLALPLLLLTGGDAQSAVWVVALHRLPSVLLALLVDRRLGVSGGWRELAVLPALGLGLLAGWGVNGLFA